MPSALLSVMEASARILATSAAASAPLNRHIPVTTLLRRLPPRFPSLSSRHRIPCRRPVSFSFLRSPGTPPLSISSSHLFYSPYSFYLSTPQHFDQDPEFSGGGRPPLSEKFGDPGLSGGKGAPVLTAVLLGWLGAEEKHLKKYAELYRSRGIRTVRFVVKVGELLGGFDLGRRVEGRIARFVGELVDWLEEAERDGEDRGLLFHTFSNTGWLVYGAMLNNLQQRGDYIKKIRGCVVDSGGDPEINPQVWAAGFTAALLKRRSSLAQSSLVNADRLALDKIDDKEPAMQDMKPSVIEIMLLSILEIFFSTLLKLPDVHGRLSRIISILLNQPLYPQLYLYSTADKVIPVHSVESFIEQQKHSGRQVLAYNFVSSPHVDHLRSFPCIYSAEVDKLLRECGVPFLSRTN